MINFLQRSTYLKKSYRRFLTFISTVKKDASPLIHDYHFLIYALAITLLGWGFAIFNSPFSCDDLAILRSNTDIEFFFTVARDRWSMIPVRFFFGEKFIPVVPMAVNFFCYFLSFCILFYSSRPDKYFIFPIYMLMPVLFHLFSFLALSPAIGIGAFFSALSVYAFHKSRSKICLLIAAFFLAFSIGLYSIFFVYVTMATAYIWIRHTLAHRFYCTRKYLVYLLCRFLVLLAVAYFLHKIVALSIQGFFAVKSVHYSGIYVDPIKDLFLWLKLIIAKMWAFFSGNGKILPQHVRLQTAALLLSLSMIVFLFVRQKRSFVAKLIMGICLVFIMIAPFLPDVFNQHAGIPQRVTAVCFPLALAVIFQLAFISCRPHKVMKLILILLQSFISLQYAQILNQCVYIMHLQNRRDIEFSSELQTRINELPEFMRASAENASIPVLVVGKHKYEPDIRHFSQRYPDWCVENIGLSSMHEWGVVATMQLYGYYKYTEVFADSCSRETLAFVEKMPIWPLKGSVAFYNKTLIIKFGGASYPQPVSNQLGKKLLSQKRQDMEELSFADMNNKSPLHTYDLTRWKDVKTKTTENAVAVDQERTERSIYLPACRYSSPYVILEIIADFDRPDMLFLGYDRYIYSDGPDRSGQWISGLGREMRFAFNAGENQLRIRCPAYVQSKDFPIGLGDGCAKKIILKSIKVYDDDQYTQRLLELNPGLTKEKLLGMTEEESR